MQPSDDQRFESFVPVYDVAPKTWEEGRVFLVEQLKKLSNAINVREIGWLLDEELLAGKNFIPGAMTGSTSQQFRSVLRKVIEFPGLAVGLNTQPHGINVDGNFSLIQLFASATDAATLTGRPIPCGADVVSYDANNIIINVAKSYTRAWAVIEYIQEL